MWHLKMRQHSNTDFFTPAVPRVFGHRGAAGTHPENTLESFAAALDAGVQYIEFDIHMTRDGEVVVRHDDHLERSCGRAGVIREMSSRSWRPPTPAGCSRSTARRFHSGTRASGYRA
ncbi:MAG: glycerophosphodiester phosphodiesterase [Candidatus Binatus sp.]